MSVIIMKPNETGTRREFDRVISGSVSLGDYVDLLREEEYKARYPMTYDKKKLLRYKGYFPYYAVKGYSARSVLQHPNSIQMWDRTTRFNGDVAEQTFSAAQKYLLDPFSFNFVNQQIIHQLTVEANVNYLNKVNKRKLSILEDAKTFRKTVNTIISSVLTLRKRARELFADPYDFITRARRHERYPHTRETFYRQGKTFGDVWLEGRYHWLTTYMSMRDAFIALQDMFPVMETYHKEETTLSQTLFYPRNTYEKSSRTLDVDYSYTIKLGGYCATQSEGALLAKAYGVNGVPDLASVVWELIPFSLAVDWVVPISDTLLAINAMDGLTSFATWKVEQIKILSCKASKLDKMDEWDYTTFNAREQRWYVERQAPYIEGEYYTRSPMTPSGLDIRPFIAQKPLNLLRAIDALSFFSGTKFSKKILSRNSK